MIVAGWDDGLVLLCDDRRVGRCGDDAGGSAAEETHAVLQNPLEYDAVRMEWNAAMRQTTPSCDLATISVKYPLSLRASTIIATYATVRKMLAVVRTELIIWSRTTRTEARPRQLLARGACPPPLRGYSRRAVSVRGPRAPPPPQFIRTVFCDDVAVAHASVHTRIVICYRECVPKQQ